MKTLLKNGTVVNVFTGKCEKKNILISDDTIIGVGAYTDNEADIVEDISGKFVCPGFIDAHMHIESTMLTPSELAKICIPHGTTAIIADPHEIANVCGTNGIDYMLEASEGLPLSVYIMLPSCVPATKFDESGAVLTAKDLLPYYSHKRVLGLAEVMDYPGVISGESSILEKIKDARMQNAPIDGHAPLLSGKALDKYISAGIQTDHECSSFDEAAERIEKGQWVMIRQGTAAQNLEGLIDLFDEPYCRRCVLVTDDRHAHDLIKDGQIDNIIRTASKMGKSVITGIQMATVQAAQCFGLKHIGAVAPSYFADLLILNDLESIDIKDVYCRGKKIESNKIQTPPVHQKLLDSVLNSVNIDRLSAHDFYIEPKSGKCRIIKTIPQQLITDEEITDIDWNINNGTDVKRDILKIAVIERHNHTGHMGLGFISGIGLKEGAICSSVSHDSHNIIVIGTNDNDMAAAVNHVIELGGGICAVRNGNVTSDIPLPIGGLMSNANANEVVRQNKAFDEELQAMGIPHAAAPLMTMSFVSLAVIPNIKITTTGLIDVNNQKIVPLYIN